MTQPFRSRSFVRVPPEARPVRSRRAVRVVVTDGSHVLMLRDSDPGVPGLHWWITPGGGVDPGERPCRPRSASWPRRPASGCVRTPCAAR